MRLVTHALIVSLARCFNVPFGVPRPVEINCMAAGNNDLGMHAEPSLSTFIINGVPGKTRIAIFTALPS